uniref:7TM GPCR domain containing protein n=1 Tax=Haemonchus contortus TaxID=6289 RepID=W6NF98_HAECO
MNESVGGPEVSYEDYDWWQENCAIIPPENSRLLLVGVVGAIAALMSVVFNMFLFCVLARNKRHRSSSLIYLTFLAFSDTFLSAAYILLFPVNLYMDYFASDLLAMAWWSYMRIIITISHVFISASAFLIVAAAFERYITISKIRNQFARHHRLAICFMAVVFAMIAKLPMYFEVQVVPNGNCTGVTSLTATVSEFSETEPYKTAYKFWFRSIITIVLPFILCFYLNIGIIRLLRAQHQGAKLFRFATSEHRKNIRSATLMLVFVTCTYLASNMLNVIVYTWELIDKPSLMSEQLRPFYTLSSDLVSLLTVLASACRLPIYIACNARIRCEVLDALNNCVLFRTSNGNKPISPKNKRSRTTTVRYCETGCGFMIYEKPSKSGETRGRSIGTGLDRIVLSVAMGDMNSRNNVPSNAEKEHMVKG